jgi:hypothetical protein
MFVRQSLPNIKADVFQRTTTCEVAIVLQSCRVFACNSLSPMRRSRLEHAQRSLLIIVASDHSCCATPCHIVHFCEGRHCLGVCLVNSGQCKTSQADTYRFAQIPDGDEQDRVCAFNIQIRVINTACFVPDYIGRSTPSGSKIVFSSHRELRRYV